ncbi:hypothetical protein ASG52_08195 [Methylobacterium sp. Leaf456]|uniref:hypothetical protein n=1 Tax=Methylobacterium sp. Leaf456 TaxID=1736382 RepID=UPI0006F29506|nr:hypothetical protein [Methylobacterium sp. Leaf456]KQT50044.1 hypothetical protein ASG52_08195 [Methylobacterium sp. Leaf456]
MPARAAALALICLALAPEARAAAFDDLKTDLAVCLRFELDGARARRAGAGDAVRRCAVEIERLDRADPRRLPGDRGLSPSTRGVLQSVLGSGGRSRSTR